ncbi:MAG: hypothetical protein ACFE8M_12280 [Candidatus Hermodarchaeota archaeon]
MSIKAKKLSLIRLFGAALILISLFSSLFLDFFVLNNWILFLLIIFFNLPWMILSFGLKFEINFLRNNLLKISIILGILSIILAITGILIDLKTYSLFIVVLLSNFLLLICWHYSPSIYKKEKVWAIIGGLSYAILTIIFILNILIYLFGILTGLIPILLLLLGSFLILSMELIMKRKGFLNYV